MIKCICLFVSASYIRAADIDNTIEKDEQSIININTLNDVKSQDCELLCINSDADDSSSAIYRISDDIPQYCIFPNHNRIIENIPPTNNITNPHFNESKENQTIAPTMNYKNSIFYKSKNTPTPKNYDNSSLYDYPLIKNTQTYIQGGATWIQ